MKKKAALFDDDVDVADLLAFADKWAQLGTAVQEQVVELVDNPEEADLNSNAVDLIEEKLGDVHNEIAYCIAEWRKAHSQED